MLSFISPCKICKISEAKAGFVKVQNPESLSQLLNKNLGEKLSFLHQNAAVNIQTVFQDFFISHSMDFLKNRFDFVFLDLMARKTSHLTIKCLEISY